MVTYLMIKDDPVLMIDGYNCKVLDFDRLPLFLRYLDVNYDDVMHNWTDSRCVSMSRTYMKELAACYHGIRHNPYSLAKLYHFTSLTDCYWMKESEEKLTWKDVSLFSNPYDMKVSRTALTGEYTDIALPYGKIHTPEITTQGISAKCWVREQSGIFLYKIGRKEIPAADILGQLGIPHVVYTEADPNILHKIASADRLQTIQVAGEVVVKCPILTSEDISIATWEDLLVCCERTGEDPYRYVLSDPLYLQMQIADFILGNKDRHEANWGFFVDNATGQIKGIHPLMDHDHSFCNDPNVPSQTTDQKLTLCESALVSVSAINKTVHLTRPPYLSDQEWEGVQQRAAILNNQIQSHSHGKKRVEDIIADAMVRVGQTSYSEAKERDNLSR